MSKSISPKTKVLTVGDGDLSLSLSLSRAYGKHIDLTASVLEPNRHAFLSVFSEARATLDELKDRHVPILWNLDATQLHERFPSKSWDLVSFHHPHIGLSTLENDDEAERALLHYRLLCHYLYSASQVSKLIHICLTHTQPTTWKLFEAAESQGLTLVKTMSDSKPFVNVWSDNNKYNFDITTTTTIANTGSVIIPEAAKIEPHFAAPRRYRNGKLSRHFLGKYGYRHRRTEGDAFKGSSRDVNVSTSMHYVFDATNNKQKVHDIADIFDSTKICTDKSNTCNDKKSAICTICNETLNSQLELKKHLASPVRPALTQTIIIAYDDLTKKESEQNIKRIVHPLESLRETGQQQLLLQHDRDTSGAFLIVPKYNHGKRLRWLLHHSKINGYEFSKRLAESTIKAGLVLINGRIALDSSRVLKDQDRVDIVEGEEVEEGKRGCTKNTVQKLKSRNSTKIEIVKRSSSSSEWLVAVKPAGMRTKGYNPGTLETSVSEQEGGHFVCLSSLETSCPGLCVLVNTAKEISNSTSQPHRHKNQISIRHFLLILVHGELPVEKWYPSRTVQLALEPKWRQKKINKKRKQISDSSSKLEEQSKKSVSIDITPREFMTTAIQSPEQNNGNETAKAETSLSTLQVITPEPSSSSICHFFREEGYPVVGDSFCKHEYSNLKRSIRNRLKNKLCMGCYKVEIIILENDDNNEQESITKHTIESPPPDKLSARFWKQFLQDGTSFDSNDIER